MTTTTASAEATLALAQRFLKAVNDKDLDGVLSTVSEDIVYDLKATPFMPVRGHEGMAQALHGLVSAWPDYDFVVHGIEADASIFVAEWTMTGTLAQPWPVGSRMAVPDGRSISFRGVDICPVRDGKITAKISYVDPTSWYEQLTLVDAPAVS